MDETVGKPGQGADTVVRIEGDAEDLMAYFDEQATDPRDAAIYGNFRALVDVMNAYDLEHDEIEITYSFRAVSPPAPEYTQVGNYLLVGEIEVPSADGSADSALLIDLISAFLGASGDFNLSRLAGAANSGNAAADPPPYTTISLQNVLVTSYQVGGGDAAEADLLLIG